MTCDVATKFAILKVEASRPLIALTRSGFRRLTNAAHKREEDLHLRVMA